MWEYLSTELPLCCKCNSWRELADFYFFLYPPPPSPYIFRGEVMVIWCEKKNQTVLLSFSWCDNGTFPLTDTADLVLLPNVSHVVIEVQWVAWLIWPVVMLSKWNELCGPVSAEKSQWLTLNSIKAFLNVEGSDSLRWSSGIALHLSESFPTPFTALTVHFIIYSCKQVLIYVGFL